MFYYYSEVSLSKVLSSDRGLGLEARTETAVLGSLKTMVLANTLKSYQMTNIEETYINIWLIYDPKWDNLILPWTHMNVVGQNSYAILDTSQPNVIGFCFNMGHLNELQLVIQMSEYSLREEVIRIFEYSNHSLETLVRT